MTRNLARQKDRPPALVIGLTDTQRYYREYNQDEINRLNREIKNLKRRHNAEIKDLKRRLAPIELLKMFRDLLSLDCPKELSRRTTILEGASHRERQECTQRNCLARQMLLASL